MATAAEVRAYASENGIEVGARGRLNADLVKAFNKGKRGGKRYVAPADRKA